MPSSGRLGLGRTYVLGEVCARQGHVLIMDWLPQSLNEYGPRPTRVLLLGINDVFDARSEELLIGLKSLRRYLRGQGMGVGFGAITSSSARSPGMNDTRLPVNAWIRRQRNFVDYAKPLENSNHILKSKFQSIAHDQHPGDRAAKRMGRTLARWLAAH